MSDIGTDTGTDMGTDMGRGRGMGIGIGIDKDVCIGAGQCALNAPEVFTQDDDGFSELLPEEGRATGGPDEAALYDAVQEAVRACPVGAISLTEHGS